LLQHQNTVPTAGHSAGDAQDTVAEAIESADKIAARADEGRALAASRGHRAEDRDAGEMNRFASC